MTTSPHIALPFVLHARENGCIKTKSQWADHLHFADGDRPATCNDCQRAVVKAAQPEARKPGKGPSPKRRKVPASVTPRQSSIPERGGGKLLFGKDAHRERMGLRAEKRGQWRGAALRGHTLSPSVNRRTGKPHEHRREIARRLRQRGGAK